MSGEREGRGGGEGREVESEGGGEVRERGRQAVEGERGRKIEG